MIKKDELGQDMVTEQQLQEQLFLIIFEAMSDGVILINADGYVVKANLAEAKLLGMESRMQRIGQHFRCPSCRYFNNKGLPLELEDMAAYLTIKNNLPASNTGIKIARGDGSEIWCDIHAFPVIHKPGQMVSAVQILRDITDRVNLDLEREKYLVDITRVQEEERKRLSRELHDEVAQSLSLLILELDVVCQSKNQFHKESLKMLEKLKETAQNTLDEVRRYSHELRPSILDNLGLAAAVESLIDDLSSGHKIKVDYNIDGKIVRLADEVELALFRIAQEALTNIRKHSAADKVSVKFKFTRNAVRLSIVDNGIGFDIKNSSAYVSRGHLGLVGMKERANLIKGTLQMTSKAGKGTRVCIEVPLN